MADPPTTFRQYYIATPDPYPAPGDVYASFLPGGAIQPAVILAATESTVYPSLLMLAAEGTFAPQIALAPFSSHTLPGVAPPADKFAFGGDVSPSGVLPAIITLTGTNFHQVLNTTVLGMADTTIAWAGAPPGTLVLPAPGAGDNVEQVSTRRALPVPPPYAGITLQAWVNGRLSWQWLWENTAVPIQAIAEELAAYQPWVDFLRVSSIMRAAMPPGGGERNPATEIPVVANITTAALQDRALQVARHFLAGLREPAGIGAQLALMTANQQQLQMQIIANQAPRPVTMAGKYPPLWNQVRRVAEIGSEVDCPPFWVEYPQTKSGSWLGCAEAVTIRIAQNQDPPMVPPILAPALITDIGSGRLVGQMNDITDGLSIFRIIPGNSPSRAVAANRNRVYNTLAIGTGMAQVTAVELVLANDDVELPQTSETFRGMLEGYYVLALAVIGPHNRAVNEYYLTVVRHRANLITLIEQSYPDERQRCWIFAVVLTFIFRLFNDYLTQLLALPPPDTTGVPSPEAPPVPPFADIRLDLQRGRLASLTEVPPGLFAPLRQPAATRVPSQATAEPSARASGSMGGNVAPVAVGGVSAIAQRRVVERPNQNPRLKAAWRETGRGSIFGEGSPFHDASQPNRKARVESDAPGLRICLPMALRGVCYDNCTGKHGELTTTEEQRVAQKGGLHL